MIKRAPYDQCFRDFSFWHCDDRVTVHGHSMPAHCNRILPMLRIPNRQNLLPQLYCTEFSVQKIPTVYSNTIGALFLSSIRVQPLCSSQRRPTNFLKGSVLCRLFRSISVYCLRRMCIFAKCFFTAEHAVFFMNCPQTADISGYSTRSLHARAL